VRRRELAAAFPDALLDVDPSYGIGTTEYMRSVGGAAVTLECGQHEDPGALDIGHAAIVNTLAHLGLIDAADPAPASRIEALSLCEVVDRISDGDAFSKAWKSFDRVAAGERIGTRADGAAVVAPFDGVVVFPNADAQVGQEWFYLARESDRCRGNRRDPTASPARRAGAREA